MIAVVFPEAGAVRREELELRQPLGAFPGVEAGHDEARGATVFEGNGFAIMQEGDERVFGEEVGERQVCRETPVVTMGKNVLSLGLQASGAGDEFSGRDALPDIAEAAPAGDAVESRKTRGCGADREIPAR